jgi:hypothetical protein
MERHIKYITANIFKPRITYRPSDGEILVKVPNGTSDDILKVYQSLAESVKMNMPTEIDLTMRGVIETEDGNRFKIRLRDNNQKVYSKTFYHQINS